MVVARNWRSRRSLAASSSSPTSLMLPPDGASAPFCKSPITVSAVTDLPDPLSPTRHIVSRSRTCSEMPSMIFSPRGFLPRLTTRSLMWRMTLVMRSSQPSFRGDAKHRTRNLEIPGLVLAHHPGMTKLDCVVACARRNDGVADSLPALALLQAGIERVARGISDQIDAEDRDRQHQSRPEDQRRFYLKIGAALGHDVAPARRLRADAGAEERQDRLGEDGVGANEGALHDQRRDGVRHQMPPHDLGQARSDRDRAFHIRLLARRQ